MGIENGSMRRMSATMIDLEGLGRRTPQLPASTWTAALVRLSVSAALHLLAVATIVTFLKPPSAVTPVEERRQRANPALSVIAHLVFIARDVPRLSGGGGGGNRNTAPIRHAEGVGRDAITLRTTPTSPSTASDEIEHAALPRVLLDARPLASGTSEVPGLPVGGISFGTSTGPGSGGGVGDGSGTGIGDGAGPGLGPGSGGGVGGGAYTPGGMVSPPRVIREVKPSYSTDALIRKIQGHVVLELVVNREGRAQNVRVVRSLDPGGLDEQAIAAVREWRFAPGHVAGTPVDVAVTIVLEFSIQ